MIPLKYAMLSVIVSAFAARECSKDKIPVCIQQRITEIHKQPKWNPPAEVNEYAFNGKRVFLFTADCCDQYNTVVDENCIEVCAPSGGITGKGDNKCPDFGEKAKFVKTVWRDPR